MAKKEEKVIQSKVLIEITEDGTISIKGEDVVGKEHVLYLLGQAVVQLSLPESEQKVEEVQVETKE